MKLAHRRRPWGQAPLADSSDQAKGAVPDEQPPYPCIMTRTTTWTSWVFYVGCILSLGMIVTKAHAEILPSGLAAQVGHNSEALLFAVVIVALVQFARPWVIRHHQLWVAALSGATILIACGFFLLQTNWPPQIVTLNEAFIGSGFVWVYICLSRPFRYWALVTLLILAFVVLFFNTEFVLDQAESLVPLLIAPIALDLIDRTILEPEQSDRRILRVVWIAILLAVAILSMVAAGWARSDLSTPLKLGIDYSQRAAEAYWGWIIIHTYFGYFCPPRLRRVAVLETAGLKVRKS